MSLLKMGYYRETPPDEVDPGKDLFALLFLAFFLINSIMLISFTSGGRSTPVNAAGRGKGIAVAASLVARLVPAEKGILLKQGGRVFLLPAEAKRVAREAKFVNIKGKKTLIIANPGKSLDAGRLLKCVSALNGAGIAVEFRDVY